MAVQRTKSDITGDIRRRAEALARKSEQDAGQKPEVISPAEAQSIRYELQVHQIQLEMQNEELRLAQQLLEESRDRYFVLYNFAPVGYLTVNQKGLILEANLTASNMLAVKRNKLVKQSFTRFIHPEDQDIYYLHRQRLFATAQPQMCEMRMFKNDGALFWAHLKANLALETTSPPVCRVVITDISEHKQGEAKTLEIEALKVINQAKSELLANVSHELRTPLASIKGFIETLIEPDVNWSKEKQLEFLIAANNQTDRLTLLIRDLLDMSQIESGKLKLTKSYISAAEFLNSASHVLSIVAIKHNLKIGNVTDALWIQADKGRLMQIMSNLVENAAKFSPELSLIQIEVSADRDSAVFSVEDQGIGMTAEVVANLFNRFYQAQNVVEGKTKGTGLGLTICKGIVEAHGGKIWVTSKPDKGSKFSFSIPME